MRTYGGKSELSIPRIGEKGNTPRTIKPVQATIRLPLPSAHSA
jgi:hypothetical protein